MRSTLMLLDSLEAKVGKRGTKLVAITMIIGIAFVMNLYLVAKDNRPPLWDYAGYLSRSLEFYYAVRAGSLSQFISVFNEPYRPPLVSLAALPFYLLFGTSYRSAMLVNLVFIAILVFSTYKLGETLHSPQFGLVAAAIVTTVPGIFIYSRIFGLDFPIAALVAIAAYAVIASVGFSKRNMSILAGVLFGLGMLIKWSYFVFVLPVVLAEAVQYGKKTCIFNLVLGGFFAGLVATTWYGDAIAQGLVNELVYYAYGSAAVPYSPSASPFDLSALLYYPEVTYNYVIGQFYSLALMASVVLLLVMALLSRIAKRRSSHISRNAQRERSPARKWKAHPVWSLAFALIFATVALTSLENKGARFFLGAVPMAIPLILWAGWKVHTRLGAILMIAIAIAGTSATVVGALQPAIGVRLGLYAPGTDSQNYVGDNDYQPPQSADWKVEQTIALIASLNPRAKVGMLTSHWVFNQDTFHYYALRMEFGGLQFHDYRDTQLDGLNPYQLLDRFDFVLRKTGDLGETWNTNGAKLVVERLDNASDPFYHSWKDISTWDIPDGSQLSVFMKMPSSTTVTSTTVNTGTQGERIQSLYEQHQSDLRHGDTHAICMFRALESTSVTLSKRGLALPFVMA